ncbi:hypothetical protein DH2020_015601 [Rehmannia glutinosa]|uniref:ZF-HD dimerization-type domain-containing protein n=1 Tax=Rehmannia glutinosa TaxID=99300 RepID=A0ABR0WU62_REHGL
MMSCNIPIISDEEAGKPLLALATSSAHHQDANYNNNNNIVLFHKKSATNVSGAVKYMECLKNHAAAIGGNATDGCGEFMGAGQHGTIEALKCSACNCHRNFHRKIHIQQQQQQPSTTILTSHHDYINYEGGCGGGELVKKRFRTKFSGEQKEKMLEFAEKAGWKLTKMDDSEVRRFCQEIGIKRKVLKVWMHNNKYHLLPKNNTTTTTTTTLD